jgi:regulator of ribonuclease activity A
MSDFVTCDLYDEHTDQVRVVEPIFQNFGGNERFAGKIVTIKCHEDNSLVKDQVALSGEGRVLVVDGGGSLRCALLGDQLALKAAQNGWAGLVIYGCVRDIDELQEMELGVQALAITPRKSVRQGRGDLDIPVTFAGVTFHPGEYIYADNNGILVSDQWFL